MYLLNIIDVAYHLTDAVVQQRYYDMPLHSLLTIST